MRGVAGCALIGLLTITGCHRDISGSYLASDKSGVMWLQLVRTPDNHLNGELATALLRPDGTVDRQSISVTGAVDGENVTISASRFLGLESVELSGTLRGDTLTLTSAGQTSPSILNRARLSDYQAAMKTLDSQSQGILAAKASRDAQVQFAQEQQNFLSAVNQLISRMEQFDSAADIHLGRFPGAEERYRAITARVAQYVNRDRQFAGNPNASAMRGQLYIAAIRSSQTSFPLHDQQLSLETAFQNTVNPISQELASLQQKCAVGPSGLVSPTLPQSLGRKLACERLSATAGVFRQKANAMGVGLQDLEQIYQQEHQKQQELIQEAANFN